jgi:hypothetical protein
VDQIELQLSEFTLRSRSVAVTHAAAGVQRGLEPGEPLVVRDPRSGHYFAAAVADVDFEPSDTVYRIELGSRLAAEEASDWLAPVPAADSDEVTTRQIMELLGELNRSRRMLRALTDEVAH